MASKHLISSALVLLVAACASETKRTVIVEEPAVVEEVVDFGGEGNQLPTTAPVKETCAAQTQVATPVPLHLVVVLDASGSMSASYEDGSGGSSNRLDAIKNALINYSKVSQPTPVSMSIVPYGISQPLPGGTGRDECAAAFYAPLLKDTKLPNVGIFQRALAGLEPTGGTPTGGAVLGSTAYARKLRVAFPKDNIAMIVATDGDPSGCSGAANVNTALATAFTAGYPTFVIGVGEDISSLNAMAVSGGTGTPLLIDGVSATVVTQKMNRKFEEIRSAFSCELQLPTTFPNGTPTDKSQINVDITNGEGVKSALVYSQDCSKPNAFKYDDAAAPTKVMLCEDICTTVKADRKAKQDLLMGCPSKVN